MWGHGTLVLAGGADGTLQLFDGVSHFVEEHRPDEIADAVVSVVSSASDGPGRARSE